MVKSSFFIFIILASHLALGANKTIDRYTQLRLGATPAQSNELSVIINIKFPKSINNIIAAIEYLLLRSSYKLSLDYQAEILNRITLPVVHRQLGPIELKRAIEILIGKPWALIIDDVNRDISIVLNKTTNNTHTAGFDEPQRELSDIVKVNINKDEFSSAIKKILPNGWEVDIEEALTHIKVSIVAEEVSRLDTIKSLSKQVSAELKVFPAMKLLIIRSVKTQQQQKIEKVIK